MEEVIFRYLSEQIADYEILCKVGKGAYGTVYKIKKKENSQLFALKTMELQKMNEKTIQNTLNEIRILCSIDNKFICGYEDAFTIDNGKILCIVMEYVGGGDMYSKIETCRKKNYRINEESIWKYMCQILIGLKNLHDLKIIHRDIKSANLLLTDDFETLKLGDMGIAKIAKQDFAETQVGTPYYLAPEIWQKNTYDYRCDIFSLGCVAYEMATLTVPFQGDSLQALYKSVKRGLIKRIPQIYSSELYGIIKLMLKRNPEKRPSTYDLLAHPIIQSKMTDFGLIDFKTDQKKITELMETIILPKNIEKLNTILKTQKKMARTKSCGNFAPQQFAPNNTQQTTDSVNKQNQLPLKKSMNPPTKKMFNPPQKKRSVNLNNGVGTPKNFNSQNPKNSNKDMKYKILFDSKKQRKNSNVQMKMKRVQSNTKKSTKTKLGFFNFF